MRILDAYRVRRLLDTKSGFDKMIDMIIENDCFDAMNDVNVIIGKAIDEVAEKNGVPFCLNDWYTGKMKEGDSRHADAGKI